MEGGKKRVRSEIEGKRQEISGKEEEEEGEGKEERRKKEGVKK